mmetsp:Transcript_30422/g.93913  ORF Transcript_30422/g.93913 Transcript_30422/m.93913 type:complete len:222 (+) Transcript_30422:718-1383(+)
MPRLHGSSKVLRMARCWSLGILSAPAMMGTMTHTGRPSTNSELISERFTAPSMPMTTARCGAVTSHAATSRFAVKASAVGLNHCPTGMCARAPSSVIRWIPNGADLMSRNSSCVCRASFSLGMMRRTASQSIICPVRIMHPQPASWSSPPSSGSGKRLRYEKKWICFTFWFTHWAMCSGSECSLRRPRTKAGQLARSFGSLRNASASTDFPLKKSAQKSPA